MDSLQHYWLALITVVKSVEISKAADFLQTIAADAVGLGNAGLTAILASGATSFVLITAAEIGDKSQLVCMALAAKHRPLPIFLGALAAFALLNSLAVGFGAAVAAWFPDYIIALAVAALFLVFGFQALRTEADEADENIQEKSGHNIFFTTFLLITVAEFGDKTQLAVVALSSTNNPAGVWLGATVALGFTSALGVIAGRKLVQRVPLELLHKLGGILFLLLAVVAGIKAYGSYTGR
jgi:Ca2+/H+ antiporter, TMEM165/GDT1 family